MTKPLLVVHHVSPDDMARAKELYRGYLKADLIALLALRDAELERLANLERSHRASATRAKGEKQMADKLWLQWRCHAITARHENARLLDLLAQLETDTTKRPE